MSYTRQPAENSCVLELTKQNTRLAIINQIAKSINVQMSYEDIIDHMSIPLRSVISYDLLSFCLLDNGKLIIKSSAPKNQKLLGVGTVLHNYNSAPWQAIISKQCFLRQDIWNDAHKYQEDDDLVATGIKSAIMSPLLVNNEVIGAVNLGSKRSYAFSKDDSLFVQQLADQMAVCIQNMLLYNEVFKAKREWEQTFKAVLGQIYLIDSKYNILRVNNEIDGVPPGDIVGKKCHEVFPFCNRACHECPVETAFRMKQSILKEINIPHLNQILNINVYPVFNENNEPYSIVVYIRDVTAKRQIQAQLFHSAKLAAIGEMAAGVAHELNNPLTAIIGNASVLLRITKHGEKAFKLLEDVKHCGQRCKRIIQNLLTFARQDNYSLEPLDINQVVTNSLSLVAYQIQKSNIYIKVNPGKNLPPIMGNKQQLEQVIINFLLNARDALDNTKNRKIIITTRIIEYENKAAIEVAVFDNGEGIEAKNLEHIFNPFFTTKNSTKGTGLGLSVSLGIAETHRGTIKVRSKPGNGSTFSLILPL